MENSERPLLLIIKFFDTQDSNKPVSSVSKFMSSVLLALGREGRKKKYTSSRSVIQSGVLKLKQKFDNLDFSQSFYVSFIPNCLADLSCSKIEKLLSNFYLSNHVSSTPWIESSAYSIQWVNCSVQLLIDLKNQSIMFHLQLLYVKKSAIQQGLNRSHISGFWLNSYRMYYPLLGK